MKKTLALLTAVATAAIIAPSGANAQLLSANIGGLGASIGTDSYGYYDTTPSYSSYYYPNTTYGYNYPVQQTVRYNTTTSYPSNYYSSSYNSYPAYYNTGYSYPANSYSNYTYSAPTYGTGVSVGIGM